MITCKLINADRITIHLPMACMLHLASFGCITIHAFCTRHELSIFTFRRELNTWWFHLHRALSVLGLILAVAGAASGGNLLSDDYHQNKGGSAHKALGILAVVAAALQVEDQLYT